MRRFTDDRQRELREFGKGLYPPQPNFERAECSACGLAFSSEAAFTFHQRMMGPRVLTVCLTESQLRRRRFKGTTVLRAPSWVEYWYLDELQKEHRKALSGFTREAWAA